MTCNLICKYPFEHINISHHFVILLLRIFYILYEISSSTSKRFNLKIIFAGQKNHIQKTDVGESLSTYNFMLI